MKNIWKYIASAAFILLALVVNHTLGAQDVSENVPYFTANAGGAVAITAAVAKTELIERELINKFRHEGTWLQRVPSKNQWVNADVIKLNEIGADPEVLINNSTYPIAVSDRPDESTAISLYKYDTTNTKVTDDEIYGLPYDKPGSVQRQHRETLEERTQEHGLHSLAPAANTAKTPILETTGADDGTGRRRLTKADLIKYRKTLNDLKLPARGRILVLCSEHEADLMLEDKDFENKFNNHKTGELAPMHYGFEVYTDVYAPVYDGTLNKIAFDSVTAGRAASVLFHVKGCAKARGSVKAYVAKAENDPQNRETVMGLRLYNIVIPTRLEGQGAIVSANVI